MADLADVANEFIELNLRDSLAARPQNLNASYFTCEDCDKEIPPQRRAIGGVTRCVDCQTIYEARQKHFRA